MIIKVPTDKKTTHAHSRPCSVAVDHLFFRTAVRDGATRPNDLGAIGVVNNNWELDCITADCDSLDRLCRDWLTARHDPHICPECGADNDHISWDNIDMEDGDVVQWGYCHVCSTTFKNTFVMGLTTISTEETR